MKFGKLANLKKWHLLWVAGRQMWPNGNGNGYHCQKQGYWSGILLPVFCELTPALSWLVAEVQLALEELVWVEAKKAIGGHQVSSHYDQLMGSVRSLTFHERGFVFVPSSVLYFRISAVAQCTLYTQIACHKSCDTRWVATTLSRSNTSGVSQFAVDFGFQVFSSLNWTRACYRPRLLMASKPMSDAMRSAQLMSSALRWNHNLFWPDMLGPKLTQY